LRWLTRELSPTVTVSIMSQYTPLHRAQRIPLLSRTITAAEYEAVLRLVMDLDIENGWTQEIGASENYIPDFEREDHPFI
jgi:putative pyruvate formate lyase activating enzyme